MGTRIRPLLAICDSVGPPHKKSCVTAKISVTFVTSVEDGPLPGSMFRSHRQTHHQFRVERSKQPTQRPNLFGLAAFLILFSVAQAGATENPGDLDTSFNNDGWNTISGTDLRFEAASVVVQSSGKVVVAGARMSGFQFDPLIARFNTDGSLDTSFGSDGTGIVVEPWSDGETIKEWVNRSGAAVDVALLSDDRIVVTSSPSGNDEKHGVMVFTADGVLDTSFDGDGRRKIASGGPAMDVWTTAVTVTSDDKIMFVGTSPDNGWDYRMKVYRLNTDGSNDTSFNNDGMRNVYFPSSVDNLANAVVMSGEKTVFGGSAAASWQRHDMGIGQLTSDGSNDTAFASGDGRTYVDFAFGDSDVRELLVQGDGKIVAIGESQVFGNEDSVAVTRLNADGSLDTSFSDDGKFAYDFGTGDSYGWAGAIDAEGRIVIAGQYNDSSLDKAFVMRLTTAGEVDTSFGTGGIKTFDFVTDHAEHFNGIAVQGDDMVVAGGSGSDLLVARLEGLNTVLLVQQSITFNQPANDSLASGGVTLSAIASSGLPVSYASSTTGVCTVSGAEVTYVSAGTCTITASQPGDAAYAAAADVTQSFNVAKASQSITFDQPANDSLASGGVTLSAIASSGLTVSYASSTTGVCTLSGAEVTYVSAGTCTITASQPGDTTYAAAADVSRSFAIGKAPQSITFNQPADDVLASGGTYLTGSASSGLPVTYASSTTDVCTVSGADVAYVTFGICSIVASQAGDNQYEPAADVTQAFNICNAANDCDGDGANSDKDTDDLDPDVDGDSILDGSDNCPLVSNAGQADTDSDGNGDACSEDADGDGTLDNADNCPLLSNAEQVDTDSDGIGDLCDDDDDNDGVLDVDEVREDCRIKVDCDDDGETDLTDPFPLAVTEVSLDTGASIKTVPPDRLSTCSLNRSAAYLSPYTESEGMESIGTQAHFSLTGCNGSVPETVEVEVDFGMALPAEGLVCKVEGTSEPVDMNGASISGTSVTYTLTDNGQFDANSAAGVIDDPVTVIIPNDTEAPTAAPAVPVPIRSFWLLLAGLLIPALAWRLGRTAHTK